MKYPIILALALSTSFLAACGGGGGDAPAGPVVSTPSFPLDAAYTKAATTNRTFNGTAIDGADTWNLTWSTAVAADEVFEGALSKKASQSLTLKVNGVVGSVESFDTYFSINPLTSKGGRYADGSYAVLTSNTGVLPNAAKVGDAGTLGTLTTYTSDSKTTVKFTTQSTWTLEADTATTALGCSNSVIKDAAGTQTSTGSVCFKIDTSGNILGMRFTVSIPGKTLVFQ